MSNSPFQTLLSEVSRGPLKEPLEEPLKDPFRHPEPLRTSLSQNLWPLVLLPARLSPNHIPGYGTKHVFATAAAAAAVVVAVVAACCLLLAVSLFALLCSSPSLLIVLALHPACQCSRTSSVSLPHFSWLVCRTFVHWILPLRAFCLHRRGLDIVHWPRFPSPERISLASCNQARQSVTHLFCMTLTERDESMIWIVLSEESPMETLAGMIHKNALLGTGGVSGILLQNTSLETTHREHEQSQSVV